MSQDAVEPSGESAATVEAVQGSPGFDERFLGEILGPMAVFAEGEGGPPEGGGMPLGEPLKGHGLAGLGTVDQVAFVVEWVHRIRDCHVGDKRFARNRKSPPGLPVVRAFLRQKHGPQAAPVNGLSPKQESLQHRQITQFTLFRLGLASTILRSAEYCATT